MKKVLSLVLVLTLVLGSFSFAFAATPTDVVGTEYEDAVKRLGELKVLEGYEDGTFRPENTITRAEFAAVVVRAKGLEAAAQAAKGTTAFSDVAAGSWASGYINIASKMGFVKGMGDGTFAPNSPVTYEQAVTMVMRALGYEEAANARGGYPYGYLIVANENGLLDSVRGTQGAPAPRGLVAQLVDNALEIKQMVQVGFGTQTKWVVSGTEGTKERTLLDDLGFYNIVGRVVKVDTAKGKVTIENDDETKTLDVKKGFDFEEVEGLTVKAWYTSNEIKLVKVLDTPKYDAVKPADKKVQLIGENKKYSLAKDAVLIVDEEEVELKDFTADYAKVVFDKDGDIIWAKGYTFDDTIVVEKVDEYVVESYGYDEEDFEDYTIVKEGKTITVEDLEKNDVVFYNKDLGYAVVYNNGIVGKIGRIYTDSFGFEGKTYFITGTSASKFAPKFVDADKLGALTTEVLQQMKDKDEEVTVFLDFAKNVVLVAGTRDIETVNSNYYLVTENTTSYTNRTKTYWTVEVLNSEGKTQSLDVTDDFVRGFAIDYLGLPSTRTKASVTATEINNSWKAVVAAGNIIQIDLDEDGEIVEVVELDATPSYTASTDAFKVTASYVKGWKLQPSTVIFRNDGAASFAKHSVTTLEKAEEKFTQILEYTLYLTSNGRVAAIYANKTNAKSDVTYSDGLITNIKNLTGSAKKAEVTIYVKGEKQVYLTTQKLISDNNIKKHDIVRIGVGNKTGEIEEFKPVTKATVKVSSIDLGNKTINGNIELMDKAVIYDSTDDYAELKLRDLKKDNNIVVYFNEDSTRFVNYVVLLADDADDDSDVTKGTVTYIDASVDPITNTFKIEVDGKVYTIDNNTVIRNEIGVIEGTTASDVHSILTGLTSPQVFDVVANGRVISEFKYVAKDADRTAAKDVIDKINALAESNDLATDVPNARSSYAALTAVQKRLVPSSVLAKLVKEEAKLAVAAAKATLAIGYQGSDSATSVTQNLTLPTSDTDVKITWASSNKNVIDVTTTSGTGAVTRPSFETGDVEVILTATITADNDPTVKDTVTFTVKVIKLAQTDLSKATEAAQALEIVYATGDSAGNVTQNLTLPSAPTPNPHGASVTWVSSNTTVISVAGTTGTVTRPVGQDIEVTLTATVTVGSDSVIKTFTVIVKGL